MICNCLAGKLAEMSMHRLGPFSTTPEHFVQRGPNVALRQPTLFMTGAPLHRFLRGKQFCKHLSDCCEEGECMLIAGGHIPVCASCRNDDLVVGCCAQT